MIYKHFEHWDIINHNDNLTQLKRGGLSLYLVALGSAWAVSLFYGTMLYTGLDTDEILIFEKFYPSETNKELNMDSVYFDVQSALDSVKKELYI